MEALSKPFPPSSSSRAARDLPGREFPPPSRPPHDPSDKRDDVQPGVAIPSTPSPPPSPSVNELASSPPPHPTTKMTNLRP